MKISVLIATCNRAALLEKCIASLLVNTRPAHEIIIVDQSDGGETESLVRGLDSAETRLHYRHVERRGKSRALNEAVKISSGELLALTDDDVEVPERWLETIDELHSKHPRVAGFCGRVLPEPGSDPTGYYNLVLSEEPRWITRRSNPLSPGFCGANIVVRRSSMIDVGAYNVHFGPGALFKNNDDGDLAYRLTRRGGELLYAPELFVFHSSWRGETDTRSLKFDYTYSLGAFAGYYFRRGHSRPALFLAKKGLFKTRQLLTGLFTRDASKRDDARVQLNGMGRGFARGLRVSEPGTVAPLPPGTAAEQG
jgi:GT2 family glycosyltransferase